MFKVQFITHQTESIGYADSVRIALQGGCRWIQLRMKQATDDEVAAVAEQVIPLCRRSEATFILDDRVHLVKEVGADGVHLGKNDMPIDEARTILGNRFIIGGTANTFEDLQQHLLRGADYIGCGPFRFTTTKANLAPILGLEGYQSIVCKMQKEGIHLPIIAIGGIDKTDLSDLSAAGVDGIALSGSILRAEDPVAEMKTIMQLAETL